MHGLMRSQTELGTACPNTLRLLVAAKAFQPLLLKQCTHLELPGAVAPAVCAGAAQELPSLGAVSVYSVKQRCWSVLQGQRPQPLL